MKTLLTPIHGRHWVYYCLISFLTSPRSSDTLVWCTVHVLSPTSATAAVCPSIGSACHTSVRTRCTRDANAPVLYRQHCRTGQGHTGHTRPTPVMRARTHVNTSGVLYTCAHPSRSDGQLRQTGTRSPNMLCARACVIILVCIVWHVDWRAHSAISER